MSVPPTCVSSRNTSRSYPWKRLLISFFVALIASLGISYATYRHRTVQDEQTPTGALIGDPSITWVTPMGVFQKSLTLGLNGEAVQGTHLDVAAAFGNALIWFIPLGLVSLLI